MSKNTFAVAAINSGMKAPGLKYHAAGSVTTAEKLWLNMAVVEAYSTIPAAVYVKMTTPWTGKKLNFIGRLKVS